MTAAELRLELADTEQELMRVLARVDQIIRRRELLVAAFEDGSGELPVLCRHESTRLSARLISTLDA